MTDKTQTTNPVRDDEGCRSEDACIASENSKRVVVPSSSLSQTTQKSRITHFDNAVDRLHARIEELSAEKTRYKIALETIVIMKNHVARSEIREFAAEALTAK